MSLSMEIKGSLNLRSEYWIRGKCAGQHHLDGHAWRAQQCVAPQVGEATCLDSLSYHEAWELSYFGASVLHPRTTMPARKFGIPIVIRNFFNQSAPGGSLLGCTRGCFRCSWSCAAGPVQLCTGLTLRGSAG